MIKKIIDYITCTRSNTEYIKTSEIEGDKAYMGKYRKASTYFVLEMKNNIPSLLCTRLERTLKPGDHYAPYVTRESFFERVYDIL